MSTTPDTLVVTGPVLQQVSVDQLYATPLGGAQTKLQSLLNGGTVAAGGLLVNFSSITPAGSTAATATVINAVTTQLGTAASTTGAVFPPAGPLVGLTPPLLIINDGTAAIHVYANGTDTIDNTAGTTGVTLTNAHRCFFTPVAAGKWSSGPEGGVTS